MREGKDRGGKWLIEHHGDAILHMAGIRGFEKWQAIQPQVVQQGRTPDGLLEVVFPGETEPDLVLLEIYTYPASTIADDILRDLLLVYLDRGKVPEVVTLILHPKGNLSVLGEGEKNSRLETTKFSGRWRVINLWEIKAEDLLATNEVGLIPWVPLARYEGSPDALLQLCRECIEKQAPENEWSNLLAITQIMASMRYDIEKLSTILGGTNMLTENPLLRKLFAEKSAEVLQLATVDALEARFGGIPENLAAQIRSIQGEDELKDLHRFAVTCPSIEAFHNRLQLQ